MALKLTNTTQNVLRQSSVQPNTVVEFESLSTLFGSASIKKKLKIGDFVIGDGSKIGGLVDIAGQSTLLDFENGRAPNYRYTIRPDRGDISTVASLVIEFLDENDEFTNIIAPGEQVTDLLGDRVVVRQGFVNSSYPEDYNTVFRGKVEKIEAGTTYVQVTIASTEKEKFQPILRGISAVLQTAIADTGTPSAIELDDATDFSTGITGPDGTVDSTVEYLVRINDEFFQYETKTLNDLETITRPVYGIAAAHDSGDDVNRSFRFQDKGLTIFLKLCLSGWADNFATGVTVTSFERINSTLLVENAIFFEGVDVEDVYGLTEGDYVSTTGATNGANNFTLEQISSVEKIGSGSFIVMGSGVTLVEESGTSATISFRSKYDTYPIGLRMRPDEVDVEQIEFIRDTFLPLLEFDLVTQDEEDLMAFLENKILRPMACYSIPRKGRTSIAYHTSTLPGVSVKTLNTNNVLNPEALRLVRSQNQNFKNEIQYQYNWEPVNQRFSANPKYESTESKTRITSRAEVLKVEAQGVTTANDGQLQSRLQSQKLLDRYQFGAEYINRIEVHVDDLYSMEVADAVIVDFSSLKISDPETGTRLGGQKVFEIVSLNRNADDYTGTIDVLSTSAGVNDRFGLYSPESIILAGSTTTKLTLQKSFSTKTFQFESSKWDNDIGEPVEVVSPDFSVRGLTTIVSFDAADPQSCIIAPALAFTPGAGYYLRVPSYDDSSANQRTRYAYRSPTLTVVSAASQTVFDVSVGDAAKLFVGSLVKISSTDFSLESPEAEVTNITSTTITIDTATGFTIVAGMRIDLVGFVVDSGKAYRYF